jgi:hypothetical protein
MFKKRLSSWLLISLGVASSGFAANFFPVNEAQLIANITTANTNGAHDVIDLGGNVFIYSASDNNYLGNGFNALPGILSDSSHTLTIQNGTIVRSLLLDSTTPFRFFYVDNGANLLIDHLILQNGLIVGDGQNTPLNYAGAIYNSGTLTIDHSTLLDNSAPRGGAVYNHSASAGIPRISRSYFIGNNQGALSSQQHIDLIEYTTFEENSSTGNAGALSVFSSDIDLIDHVNFLFNSASTNGGAIGIGGAGAGTIDVISNSTFANNTAGSRGGAIADTLSGNTNTDSLIGLISNSTFYQNTASLGGAIDFNISAVNIHNSTFTNNLANSIGGALNINASSDGINTLYSNVIADNDAPTGPDISNVVVIPPNGEGFNLIGNNAASGIQAGEPNDSLSYVGTSSDPIPSLLAPLADNGGFNPTQKLFKGSLAYNRGSNPEDLEFDERGLPRVADGQTDIGAYESQSEFLVRERRHDGSSGGREGGDGWGGGAFFVPPPAPVPVVVPALGPANPNPSIPVVSEKASGLSDSDAARQEEWNKNRDESSGCSNVGGSSSMMMLLGLLLAMMLRRTKKA